jgi:hypothetical protein
MRVPATEPLPDLKRMLAESAAPAKPQTPDEQWSIMCAIAAMHNRTLNHHGE